MDKRHRKQRKIDKSYNPYEEVSSVEWEFIKMTEQEEDLIHRMHNLVGDRVEKESFGEVYVLYAIPRLLWENNLDGQQFLWALIAGRIPGRKPEEIERYWLMKHGEVFASKRREGRKKYFNAKP